MKQYKDLNLKKIREVCDIDFAHFTYKPGMCACCHGPRDLPKIYWKDEKVLSHERYEYILFKNADNGSGHVKRDDFICNRTYIEWRFDMSKMDKICRMLLEQLGEEYYLQIPSSDLFCITIMTIDHLDSEEETKKYRILQYSDLKEETL